MATIEAMADTYEESASIGAADAAAELTHLKDLFVEWLTEARSQMLLGPLTDGAETAPDSVLGQAPNQWGICVDLAESLAEVRDSEVWESRFGTTRPVINKSRRSLSACRGGRQHPSVIRSATVAPPDPLQKSEPEPLPK